MTVRSSHNFRVNGTVNGAPVDLGFHKLINDEHGYERATAPFRKEQFDAAAQVGDQSLSGWWTRGQLSFHRGAGVKYYEMLDGEEVEQRFTHSDGVDPGTAGEVVLSEEMGQTPVTRGPADSRITFPGTIAPEYVINSSGDLYKGTTLVDDTRNWTAICDTPSGSDPVYGSASDDIVSVSFSGSVTVQYTHTREAAGMWFAKERLWILDRAGAVVGDFRMLTAPIDPDTPGGALDDTAPHLSVSVREDVRPSLAEALGGVYLSLQNRIYFFGLDTQTEVPVVANGVVVAELPEQEKVTCIHHHLGYLVIATDSFVRFAVVNTDGSLTLGPSLFSVTDSGRFMASYGTRVHLLAKDVELQPTGWRMVTIAPEGGPTESELSFPWWTEDASMFSSVLGSATDFNAIGVQTRVNGLEVFGLSGGMLVSSFRSVNYSNANYYTTGSITTGFHRFGTLEPKLFQYLRVKTEGTVGSVDVAAVLPDGSEETVGSVAAGSTAELPLGTAVPDPQEYVGLKFTLNGDGDDGPTLLGYQIKALPMPKRQRLIRARLMMFDIERGPTGRSVGREKSAWARYLALEELESTNALVSYEDTDTGETGTGFIESVELLQKNGSKGNARSNGFGGVVTLTLRKVD